MAIDSRPVVFRVLLDLEELVEVRDPMMNTLRHTVLPCCQAVKETTFLMVERVRQDSLLPWISLIGYIVIMPPSALASLTNLEIEGPWTFQLRNPANPAASTHAGVLEFIAEEGCVHLPYWMMTTLRLNEGDPIRITGTELTKGKFVKLQAQSVHFLEISDPKAV